MQIELYRDRTALKHDIYRSIVAATIAIVWSVPTLAEEYGGSMIVKSIRSGSNGQTFVGVVAPPPLTCDSWGEQFWFEHTTVSGKAMLAILLTLQITKGPTDVWYLPSSAPGTTQCTSPVTSLLTGVRTR